MSAALAIMNDRPRQAQSLVEGEFVFTAEDFREIAAMLHGDAGIALPEAKATLVYSRLAKRLRALGLESFRDYCALVSGADGLDERQRMLTALTTNVTRFFREPHHFEHLKSRVLPALIDQARRGGRVRLWSAACSSGEEPYSMALSVLELAPDAADLDLKILATDIDREMVERARAGVYPDAHASAVPVELRRRWMMQTQTARGEKGWAFTDAVRRLVTFREHNLVGEWPMKGPFQAIFCRNVAIYFEEATQSKIWSRFLPLLSTDGRLYIGHSERVTGPAANQLAAEAITTYRRATSGGRA